MWRWHFFIFSFTDANGRCFSDSVIENPPRADSPREWLSRHVSPPGSPNLGREQEEQTKVAAEDTERSPSSEARGYEGEAEETEGRSD